MQTAKPIFGFVSLGMPVVSLGGYLVAKALPPLDRFPLLNPVFVLLVSVFGLPILGAACAAVGLSRREHPATFSVVGLLVNGAIPLVFFILIRLGIGSSWIDL